MRPFRIHNPTTLTEASALLREQESAAIYAGGTELLLVMKQGFLHYDDLIDIKGIPELGRVEVDTAAGVVRIGGAVTHAAVERDAGILRCLPILAEVETHVANVRVRNTGTLGGNLAFAEPHSDMGALALLLGGRVRLHGGGSSRYLGMEGFFRGPYETHMEPGEILESLELPLAMAGTGTGYQRFKVHERPSAVAGVSLRLDGTAVAEARVMVGCVGPVPVRCAEAEAVLKGCAARELEAAAVEAGRKAARAVEVIADLAGSEQFKRHLTGVLVMRACRQAGERCLNAGVRA